MKKKIICIMLMITIMALFSGCGEEDHNDGKCDICGKKASYSDNDEEYCDKHLKNAVEWYIKQGQD